MSLPTYPPLTHTAAWAALQQLANADKLNLSTMFAADSRRFERMSTQAPHVFLDYSKQGINQAVFDQLIELAKQTGVEAWRESLFAGDLVNNTEARAAMHWALRGLPSHASQTVNNSVAAALEVRQAFTRYADAVRAKGVICDVVNIGIGGSDLGPRMASAALLPYADNKLRTHFVANVDAHDLQACLQGLDAKHTLFIICSKTFTTRETLLNAKLAKEWFLSQGGVDIAQHFVAVTTNVSAAKAFGIDTSFPFWDWVGGRYSMWSSIGLSIAIAVGSVAFNEFLQGAAEMDAHFTAAPLHQNAPVLLALVELWNRNFLHMPTRCVAPYHHGLRLLPAYLQQLEMESNGKSVRRDGAAVETDTCGVIWGEAGTNSQHSFFQMLHQGTQIVPLEFILVKKPHHVHGESHKILLANALAQSMALMQGKTAEVAALEKVSHAAADISPAVLGKHRTFSGNRPSTTLLLETLTPKALGALVALYEHKTFALGALWGINPFDQWGVELGKSLALDIERRFDTLDMQGLDSSTAGLMKHLGMPT